MKSTCTALTYLTLAWGERATTFSKPVTPGSFGRDIIGLVFPDPAHMPLECEQWKTTPPPHKPLDCHQHASCRGFNFNPSGEIMFPVGWIVHRMICWLKVKQTLQNLAIKTQRRQKPDVRCFAKIRNVWTNSSTFRVGLDVGQVEQLDSVKMEHAADCASLPAWTFPRVYRS